MSSADWMPRNFHRRVEVLVPILDPELRARAMQILDLVVADSVKTWELSPDGSYHRITPPAAPMRAQARLMELARERVKLSDPLARGGGRFHILRVPTSPPPENRMRKGKRKRHTTP